jgi:hypothetical protein
LKETNPRNIPAKISFLGVVSEKIFKEIFMPGTYTYDRL